MDKPKKSRIFANNAYAVKTVWEISRKRIAHIAVYTVIGYAEWIFMSIFFMRYVIGAIESKAQFGTIMLFVGICFAVFCACAIYTNYMNAVIVPVTDNIIYRKLYRRLYAKARNVELRCFEDAAFYNRYTMALDGSSEKMVKSADCFFQIVFGIIGASAAFYSMLTIDVFSVLFLIFPILGNFVFGRLMNKVWTGRYMDNVKHNRKAEYVFQS